ncbi:MAG: calcium-binding protein [Cyanobacteriota bacterium]|nr:calcium-binding protein [Cyanobacteriota bacterium]
MTTIPGSSLIASNNFGFEFILGSPAGTSDTVTYASATSAVGVSLSIAGPQNTGGSGTDVLLSIENIIGSGFNDTLQGDRRDNILDGSSGNDTASYANAAGGVSLSLSIAGPQNTGSEGVDTLHNIENLIGSNFNDKLTGSDGIQNVLFGGNGNDTLLGTTGNDTLNGGDDVDTANYSALEGVVSLGAFGVLSKGTLGTDSLIGVETIVGSSLLGDTVNHSGATDPATGTITNLTTGLVTVNGTIAPLPLSFTVSQFENVIGSGNADSITGNIANNILSGGAGNDTIVSGAGVDTLNGGTGKDQLTASGGNDTYVYTSLSDSLLAGYDVITNYTSGDVLARPGTGTRLNSSSGFCLSLTAAQIGRVLNKFSFAPNSSSAFTTSGFTGTFIAFNDQVAGFNELSDSVIYLPTYTISASNPVAIA